MPLVSANCPDCDTPLPNAHAASCPACGHLIRETPTHAYLDLNTTTEFGLPPAEQEDHDDLVGTQLANYWIERFLGRGGMARVYRAKHLTLERLCAIKVLRPSFVGNAEDAAASFLAEARAAAALTHSHVVTIHTIGHDRNQHFIEMEYIDGCSLSTLLETEGHFSTPEATRLMVEISSALAMAHQQGMVHRDIKPANVLVTRDRMAKLADFGLAKRVQEKQGDEGRWISGTPNYMAPELFKGLPADKRSDVYAMGVTYFLLLTGCLPFAGESITDLMQQHNDHNVSDVREYQPDVPEVAARVIKQCLAKDPDHRFRDATALLKELRAIYGSLRSLESLLRESLRDTEASLEGENNRFEIVVTLDGGRRQKVIVEIKDSVAIAAQVIRISSICGPAEERHFRRALELNSEFPHGAMGVENVDGVPHFVMTNAYPRATCDVEEVRHSVLGIAQYADDAERWLTGLDKH